mmetsp:Transcript_8185/g.13829  ORF Transcript_8185/g.13829 Transcript_8185/m.13829 type:complete len:80 (+) Transcript_8185:125-364(+)
MVKRSLCLGGWEYNDERINKVAKRYHYYNCSCPSSLEEEAFNQVSLRGGLCPCSNFGRKRDCKARCKSKSTNIQPPQSH